MEFETYGILLQNGNSCVITGRYSHDVCGRELERWPHNHSLEFDSWAHMSTFDCVTVYFPTNSARVQ